MSEKVSGCNMSGRMGPAINVGVDVITALPLTKTSTSGSNEFGRMRSGSEAERKRCVNRSRTKIRDKAKRWDHKKLHSISSLLAAQLRHFFFFIGS